MRGDRVQDHLGVSFSPFELMGVCLSLTGTPFAFLAWSESGAIGGLVVGKYDEGER